MAKHPAYPSDNERNKRGHGGEDQSSGLRPGSGTSAATKAEWDRTHPTGGHNLSKEKLK